MESKSLNVGNIVEYNIGSYEFPEWVSNVIDIEDIVFLSENQNHGSYRPMILTEEWLKSAGFTKTSPLHWVFDRFNFYFLEAYKYWYVSDLCTGAYMTKIEFVHECQYFIFAMNQTELEFKTMPK